MINIEEFKNYLGHNIIVDPEAEKYVGQNISWYICSVCKIDLYLNKDGVLFHDKEFLDSSSINEKLNISCEEYIIKTLLE
jgi:hypothetical protein